MVNVVGERVRLRVKKVRVVQRVKKGKFWLIVIAKSRTWRTRPLAAGLASRLALP